MCQQSRSTDPLRELFGEVIYAFTRAEAIADGVLIDVSEMAKEAEFTLPVALTAGAWSDCVAWSGEDSARQVYQDESGRLFDVLWMASCAIRASNESGSQLHYELFRVPRDGRSTEPVLVQLKLVIGPGDTRDPVATIMLPDED